VKAVAIIEFVTKYSSLISLSCHKKVTHLLIVFLCNFVLSCDIVNNLSDAFIL